MELKALKMMDISEKVWGTFRFTGGNLCSLALLLKEVWLTGSFGMMHSVWEMVVNCLMFDWLDLKQIWEFLSVRVDQWLWYVCEMAVYRIKYEIYFAYVGYITMVWYTTKAASAFEVFCRWILWFTIVMILICIWKMLIGDIG